MTLNVLTIEDGQIKCPKTNKKAKANDCISCAKLKMIQPRDGGEVWCKPAREEPQSIPPMSTRMTNRTTVSR